MMAPSAQRLRISRCAQTSWSCARGCRYAPTSKSKQHITPPPLHSPSHHLSTHPHTPTLPTPPLLTLTPPSPSLPLSGALTFRVSYYTLLMRAKRARSQRRFPADEDDCRDAISRRRGASRRGRLSLYKPIERTTRRFNPLTIPKALQSALPFKSKPKLDEKQKRKTYVQKRVVVAEPEERKANTLMQQLTTMHNQRKRKRHEKLVEKRSKRAATTDREAVRSAALSKVAAKKRYVKAGLDDKRKAKAARRSGGGGGGGDGDD